VSGSVKIVAVITYIECPHCSVPQMGFINDPRGGSFDCDGCGKAFEVPEDAEIDFG
jgi:DNA-directed RNA polymerase subunit RPC12/RpoP